MALEPSLPTIETASFRIRLAGGAEGEPIPVLFNPASLEYSVSNEMKSQPGGRKKQYVEKSKASLKMQLVFDTTDTGNDVRAHTGPVSRLLQPVGEKGRPVPPTVKFEWGAYEFTGMLEQYKEVLDFFAPEGVPLRSTVDLTLSDQDFQFPEENLGASDASGDSGPGPAIVPSGPGGPSDVANRLGDPRASRSIAAANGSISLRAGTGGEMAVGAGVSLQGEAGFSAGAGLGLGAGVSAGAGFGAGPSASAGTASAFAGLRLNVPAPPGLPSARAVISAGVGTGVRAAASASVGSGAQVGLGGKAVAGTGGLSAEVGAETDLNAFIKFG